MKASIETLAWWEPAGPTRTFRREVALRQTSAKGAVALLVLALAGTTGVVAQTTVQNRPLTAPPTYIAPIPGQNLSPPAPRQNLVPTPPPTTRPGEGDSSLRIQGGSTRRQPLPSTNQ